MHEEASRKTALASVEESTESAAAQPGSELVQLRLAVLTNILPPFRKPLFQELSKRCKQLRVFVSTPMEANRYWQVDWGELDVTVQKTATLTRRVGYNSATDERQFVHLPIDTIPALKSFKADAILSSELGFRTSGAVIYRLLTPKSRLLVWVSVSESTEAQRGKMRHTFRKVLLKGIDGFLVNGESGARYLRKMGVRADRIYRAPHPTDVNRFAGSELNRDRASMYRLLYVGQFVERKGLLPFLGVLARWGKNNPERRVEFVLVGSGALEEAIRNAPMPANVLVSISPAVPYEAIQTIYQGAGIFVLPSLADEWGTVVSEAMACGLPVLGSMQSQAVEELVTDGVNGWRFHPGKEDQVLDKIDQCLRTPEATLSQMRRAARSAALQLSPEAIADWVTEAIRRCLTTE